MRTPWKKGESGFSARQHTAESRRRIGAATRAREAAKRAARADARDEKVRNKELRRAEREVFLDYLEKLRQAEPEAAERIIRIIRTGKDSDALAASKELLDRTRGRPVTPSVQLTANAGELTDEQAIALLERMIGAKLDRYPGDRPGGNLLQVTAKTRQLVDDEDR